MIGSIAKTYAYAKAPRVTFAALHPKTAAKIGLMRYEMRHLYGPRVTALGVAAFALPLGYLLGRQRNGRTPSQD